MILTQDTTSGEYQIRAYTPGAVTVNDKIYNCSLIITPHALMANWRPQSLAELKHEDLNKILALNPEIIILGTGKRFILPMQAQLAPIYQARLGVECMDTGAACRTFTALAAEDRCVVAALLIN